MNYKSLNIASRPVLIFCRALLVAFIAAAITGCGGGGAQPAPPTNSGNTQLTLLSTSTANDKLTDFYAVVASLTLTSQNGKSVQILNAPLNTELIHVNGNPEPLATVNVPQNIYTTASMSLWPGSFTCEGFDSQGDPGTYIWGYGSPLTATVTLPQPITIAGNSMVLVLDLLVAESESYQSCGPAGILSPFTYTPTYTLTPKMLSTPPTNAGNGELHEMEGLIASVDNSGSSFMVNSVDGSNYGGGSSSGVQYAANGPTWKVQLDNGTVFQGIRGPSQLSVGMAVDVDVSIQADGSLLATRVAVYDTNSSETALWIGPLIKINVPISGVTGGNTALYAMGQEAIAASPFMLAYSAVPLSYGNAVFGVSGQMTNIADLPFPAIFTRGNMVAGQIVALTFHGTQFPPANIFLPITTITLMPQTINGTVSAIGSSGGFTTYTVKLAPYDLFPILAVQSRQNTLLSNPNTVVVYADDNTQMFNTDPIAVGNVTRFYGLVFNDNGTLRMDCARVLDGVAE